MNFIFLREIFYSFDATNGHKSPHKPIAAAFTAPTQPPPASTSTCATMLSAEHYSLEHSAVKKLLDTRQREVTYMTDRLNSVGVQASVTAGFVITVLVGVGRIDAINEENEHYVLPVTVYLFWGSSAASIACCVHCILNALFCNIWGPGLALRGPEGSVSKAFFIMLQERHHIVGAFVGAIFFFVFQIICGFWILDVIPGEYSGYALFASIVLAIGLCVTTFFLNRMDKRMAWSHVADGKDGSGLDSFGTSGDTYRTESSRRHRNSSNRSDTRGTNLRIMDQAMKLTEGETPDDMLSQLLREQGGGDQAASAAAALNQTPKGAQKRKNKAHNRVDSNAEEADPSATAPSDAAHRKLNSHGSLRSMFHLNRTTPPKESEASQVVSEAEQASKATGEKTMENPLTTERTRAASKESPKKESKIKQMFHRHAKSSPQVELTEQPKSGVSGSGEEKRNENRVKKSSVYGPSLEVFKEPSRTQYMHRGYVEKRGKRFGHWKKTYMCLANTRVFFFHDEKKFVHFLQTPIGERHPPKSMSLKGYEVLVKTDSNGTHPTIVLSSISHSAVGNSQRNREIRVPDGDIAMRKWVVKLMAACLISH